MRIDIVTDYPNDILPINETRKCDRCGAFTWWATPRQTTRGRCWDCVSGIAYRVSSPEHHRRVLHDLLRAFPGSTVCGPRPRRYRPGTYHGPDAGPCRRCGGQIRLYGTQGHPLCLDCEERS